MRRSEHREKACPSISDVEEESLDSISLEEKDSYDESFIGDLHGGSSGSTPVFLKNELAQFFYDIERQRGHNIEIKHTGWGPFILIPDEKLEDFFSFRKKFNVEELLLVSIPLLFYLNNYGKDIKVMHVSENVVRLDPFSAVDQYKEWLRHMKDQLVIHYIYVSLL